MKNQPKTNALKPQICSAEIYETLALLEMQLNRYRQSEIVRKNRSYSINQQFDLIQHDLSALKFGIVDLLNAV